MNLLSYPVRRRRLATALLTTLLTLGVASGQHEHHAAPDPGEFPEVQDQLSRVVSVSDGMDDMTVTVAWATPGYFAALLPDQVDEWNPDTAMVFRVDETNHSESLPAWSVAAEAVLRVNGVDYQPTRVESAQAAEHHFATMIAFDVTPYQDGDVTLRFPGGDELVWDAGSWFGVSDSERVITVVASDDGFQPEQIEVAVGEPIVVVFQNESGVEHHFHVLGLDPENLRWVKVPDERRTLASYDRAVLDTAERITGHICDSDTGICQLATNVHLHADPGTFDAVGFIAAQAGRYQVVCPLHPEMVATFVVQ